MKTMCEHIKLRLSETTLARRLHSAGNTAKLDLSAAATIRAPYGRTQQAARRPSTRNDAKRESKAATRIYTNLLSTKPFQHHPHHPTTLFIVLYSTNTVRLAQSRVKPTLPANPILSFIIPIFNLGAMCLWLCRHTGWKQIK